MSQLFFLPFQPIPNQRGLPAGAAKAYFYQSGTTTLQTIYADAGLTVPLRNPVTADAIGRLPDIYMPDTATYRVRLVDRLGAPLGDDIDPYVPGTQGGPPGPADNTYTTYAALLASDPSRKSARLVPQTGETEPAGNFSYINGSWVRQADSGIASQAPGGVPQDASSRLNRVYRTPEDYGAIGYATLEAAMAATTDSTAAMQALFDFCAANTVIANGNDRWYRVTTVTVPSELTAMNISTFSPPQSSDNAPFFIDGQTSTKRNVTLVSCRGHGNRANQTGLATSGGDGQRAIFKIWGRTDNVQLLGCSAWHAATDGIWIWHANVTPANGTDYCHRDLVIQDPDVNWCGRHGISLSSVYRCRVSANGRGFLTNNGKDLPGATGGSYTDGKYGRKLNGIRYGRGITFESFPNGDGFDTMEWTGLDCRGNVSGALILHVRYTTPCYRLRVTNCQFDDPQGGNGDGAFITTATNAATGTVYTGNDGIVDASFAGNKYGRNAPFLRNIFGLTVNDTLSTVDPAVSVYGFNLATTVANIAYFSCPSNRAISGLVSPIAVSSVTQFLGTGWTASPQPLDFLGFTVTAKSQFHLRLMVTSNAAGLGAFDVLLPTGWTDISDTRISIINNDNGEPVTGSSQRSNNAGNAVSFFLKADAAHIYLVDLYFTAARP